MMKLWVDDLRTPPSVEWLWAKTSREALTLLAEQFITEMSLDHDLGGEDTSRRVVLFLCENEDFWPDIVDVHSANPVGVQWLKGMVQRYKPQL